MAKVAGEMSAAPTPWTARAAISIAEPFARPHASEAATKIANPDMSIRRRPNRSPARPPSRRRPPKVTAYAVRTHCRSVCEKWSDRVIEGSATVTIDTSSVVMK